MTTTVSPSRVRGTDSSRSSAIATPAASHVSTISACHGTANHSITASAMVGPTPSAAASSARLAPRIAAIEPNSWASARAAVGPDVPDRQGDEDPPQRHGQAFVELVEEALGVGAELALPPRPSSARG